MAVTAIAVGPTSNDARGRRTPDVTIEPGTVITAVRPDGSTVPIATATVRLTEFTTGTRGPSQMPGTLPATTAYTYALELSVDEAEAVGATTVRFSKPVAFHVDNVLGVATGKTVPVGYFDRARNQWIGMKAARIVKVVGTTNGLAELDTNGDGVADAPSVLTAQGYTAGERTQIVSRYTVGATLLRALTDHFTPMDCNSPWGWPTDARGPNGSPDSPKDSKGSDCDANGSLVGCIDQSLRQRVAIEGTGLGLVYSNLRVPGRLAAFERTIDLAGSGSLPASVKSIDLVVTVEGKTTTQSFSPASGLTSTFRWDGLDAYGRVVGKEATAQVAIGYRYTSLYLEGNNWGSVTSGATAEFAPGAATPDYIAWLRFSQSVGVSDARSVGLGGWTLNAHHVFDAQAKTVYLGDGTILRDQTAGTLRQKAGGGTLLPNMSSGRDPNPTTGTAATFPMSTGNNILRYAADGNLWINHGYVWRMSESGNWTRILKPIDVGAYAISGGCALTSDGGFIVGDSTNSGIYRFDAGTGTTTRLTAAPTPATLTCPADGDLLSAVTIPKPSAIAVAADGSYAVYSEYCRRIYQVGTDGRITTYAGGGTAALSCTNFTTTTPIDARSKRMPHVYDMAFDPDGNLLATSECHQIVRISPSGMMTALAGTSIGGFSGDAGPATAAKLFRPWGLTVDAGGGVYFADAYNKRIRYVSPSGQIRTVIGDGTSRANALDGATAVTSSIGEVRYVGRSPSGRVMFPPANTTTSSKIHYHELDTGLPVTTTAAGTNTVMAPSGAEYFEFDGNGRHLATYDALTHAKRLTFAYTTAGTLDSVTDAAANRVTMVRSSAGVITGIRNAGGAVTSIAVDADGWISSITGPSGARTSVVTGTTGLMTALTDPVGTVKAYTFDALGRLASASGSSTGGATLVRTNTATGHVVTESRGSYVSTTEVGALADGSRIVRRATPTGAALSSTTSADGKTTTTSRADGSTVTTVSQDDPVLGGAHPILASMTIRTPSGLSYAAAATRTATLTQVGDASSLTRRVDTLTVNGKSTISTYDVAAKTLAKVTATGVTSLTTFDTQGRPVSFQPDTASGMTAASYTYGSNGRLSAVTQGSRAWRYGYGSYGELLSIEDGLGRRAQLARDAAGRLRRVTTPLGRAFEWTYDAAGRVTQVALPSSAVHTLTRDVFGRLASWTPPGGTALTRTVDSAGNLTRTTLASARTQQWTYDGGGRAANVQTTEANSTFSYVGATKRLASLLWTPATGTSLAQALTWDGPLPTGIASSGAATNTFTWTYDSAFRLAQVQRNGSSLYTVTRNGDGAVTSDGAVTFTRSGPRGTVSKATVGTGELTTRYDSYGSISGRSLAVGGRAVYDLTLVHDAAGRVTGRNVTIDGAAFNDTLTYDLDDELTGVTRSGVPVETFAYDVDGNRTGITVNGTAKVATFGASGRLVASGSTGYTFTPDGFLSTRGSEQFTYGTRAELLRFVGSGGAVTYVYDAFGRRVARTNSTGTTTFEYARPDAMNLVTGVTDAGGTWTFHYDDGGFLIAADRGTTRYLVGTDQVGSVRALFTSGGGLVKRLDYDVFGQLLADSDPTFAFPLGFAGGVTDDATGLVRFGARDYEPPTGRWTTPDPFLFDGRQLNLYAYVNNTPTMRRDPSGLASYSISGYAGVGLNVEFAVTTEGFSSCVGAGVGLGVSGSVDPLGGLASDQTGTDLFAKINAGLGVDGLIATEFELKSTKSLTRPCSTVTRSFEVTGPGGVGLYSDEHSLDQDGVWTTASSNILDNHALGDLDPSAYSEREFAGGEAEGAEIAQDMDLGAKAEISGAAGICSTYKW